ncbi:MAG: class I SAM-dependent methyltransferase [Nocardioides sp.]|uniref:class I SAM-dependent methyltransferase n=1 Tax=Nocardioides sp. TaxID=35761 RepID=UPI0039E5D98E
MSGPSDARGPAATPALSFGGVAQSYERGRPTYPVEAVTWAVGARPASVLELGAGTGKLTAVLAGLGHDVFATDPDEKMLDILSAKLPEVRCTVGTAEQIPTGDGLYDVVVVGQAFHWFDHQAALPEIVRVLRPGGHLACLWNERDERIPWVRRLGELIGQQEQGPDPTTILDDSAMFSAVETTTFRHWQTVDRVSVQDLVLSRSNIAVLPEAERERKRAEVLAFYDDYGRGMDGMQLPYNCVGFRAAVLPHARAGLAPTGADQSTGRSAGPATGDGLAPRTNTAHRLPRVVTDPDDGPDSDMLLIDFR